MKVRKEIRCTGCHYKCKNSIIIDCEGDIALDAPDLSKTKCLIGNSFAAWESDDF